jgi:ribonuclease BN (tRNA processing enzyme)
MLTHFWPRLEWGRSRSEADATFGGPVLIADDEPVVPLGLPRRV